MPLTLDARGEVDRLPEVIELAVERDGEARAHVGARLERDHSALADRVARTGRCLGLIPDDPSYGELIRHG
jgi:hypothetical protein